MHTINLEYKDMLSKINHKKLIDFLGTISTEITYSINAYNFFLSSEEYADAINHLSNESRKEDLDRRLRFVEDIRYQNILLKTYHTYDEVLAYFERLKYYDLVELEEIKEELQLKTHNSQDIKILKEDQILSDNSLQTKILIPEENYLGSRFTFYSHYTNGGLYKEYHFKIDNRMTEYLSNKGDLTKYNTFKDIIYLEDPGFYINDRLICSIISHEYSFRLFLSDSEFDEFRLLTIPFSN